jgi:hypothetical protein
VFVGGCYEHKNILDASGLVTRPRVQVPHAVEAPAVTADVNDPAWASAVTISDLTPSIGTKPGTRPLPTTVKLLWDEQFLYVRFVCKDNDIYIPFQGDQRDREYYRGDAAEVFLDSVGDGRQYYEIQVTPANQVFDQTLLVTADKVTSRPNGRLTDDILQRNWWKDISWDIEGLKTAATRAKDGWIVDIAIPAKAALRRLGEAKFHPMTLHAHLMRYDWQVVDGQRVLHPLNWAPVVFGCPHQSPAAMGELRLTP